MGASWHRGKPAKSYEKGVEEGGFSADETLMRSSRTAPRVWG